MKTTTSKFDHLSDKLTEYVLQTLPAPQMAELDDLCAREPAFAAEVDELRLLLADFAATVASATPVAPPSPRHRARLLAAVATPERFSPFLATLGKILQLPVEKVRAVLARIGDESVWEKGLPGIEIFHFDAGPALAGADAGLVRFAPGATFPRHRHLVGGEITFVLEGDLIDGGVTYGPGAVVERALGSVHGCTASADRGLLTMVLHYGIEPVFSD